MSSRVARKPIPIPQGVEVKIQDDVVAIKGPKGELKFNLPAQVVVKIVEKQLLISANENMANSNAIAGTIRAILNNNVQGVNAGFTEKLRLEGVGYRAQVANKSGQSLLNLTLGLSHPVEYLAPKGIELKSPSVTEIEVAGLDKQLVGQAAADIRGICKGVREPEPYKGKGIRYDKEKIKLKETKKK